VSGGMTVSAVTSGYQVGALTITAGLAAWIRWPGAM